MASVLFRPQCVKVFCFHSWNFVITKLTSSCLIWHYSEVTSELCRLKSLTTRLFVQHLIQANNKYKSSALLTNLRWESHRWALDSPPLLTRWLHSRWLNKYYSTWNVNTWRLRRNGWHFQTHFLEQKYLNFKHNLTEGPVMRKACRCRDLVITNIHDDVIKWKHFPRYWPFVRGIHRSRWIHRTKASDAELWCFLWSAPE